MNIKGFSLIRVILFHEHSTEWHIFVISHQIFWTTCDLGTSVIFSCISPILQTSRGFAIQYLSSKTSATFTNMKFPPSATIVLSTTGFQAGTIGWKQTFPKYVQWFNKSTQKLQSHTLANSQKSRPKGLCLWYFQVALWCYHVWRSWFWICLKSHPQSPGHLSTWLAPHVLRPQQNWIQTKLLNSCGGAIGLNRS